MSNPVLSIICAIHNAESTLDRMLNSILSEGMHPDDYEIIACDDCSTDSSLEVLHKFVHDHPDIHMSILCTDEDGIHTPANTRQYGLSQASGLWIRFIDGDDTFVNEGCIKFFKYMDACNGMKIMVKSEVNQVDENQNLFHQMFTNTTLLHGNFYNRQFLLDHNIAFDPEMRLFEDMYFNSQYLANVFYFGDPNRDFGYIPEATYNWTVAQDTLSMHLFNQSHGHVEFYLIENWIKGSFAPFEKYLHIWPVPNAELFRKRLTQTTSGLYYYYENAIYRQLEDEIDDEVIAKAEVAIRKYFSQLELVCKNALRTDTTEMLLQSPDDFCEEYFLVTATNNYFVPKQSYKEFISTMS